MPTLVVHATDDTLVPFAHGQYSAQHIPGAQLITFEEGGYLVIVKDKVWEDAGRFITANR